MDLNAAKELAKPDEVAVRCVVKPAAPLNELAAKVTQSATGPPKQVRPSLRKTRELLPQCPLDSNAEVPFLFS